MSKRILITLLVLVFLFFSFIVLSIGVIESVIFIPKRSSTIQQLDIAVQSNPPNVEYVLRKIDSPDWFVASVALDRVENLKKTGNLSVDQSNQALTIIFKNLGEKGHWWRFGWDKEEAEYNQFYSQIVSTTSAFSVDLLPFLQTTSNDSNPLRREAVCRIVEQTFRDMIGKENDQFLETIRELVQRLAESDSNSSVVFTCNRILQNLPTSKTLTPKDG